MKGSRLLIAFVFGVFVLSSAVFICTHAHAGTGVGAVGAGAEAVTDTDAVTAKGTQVAVGLGAGVAPDYEGSNDYDAVPLLFVRVNWESGMYFHLEGNSMRLNLVPSRKWRLGPAVRYIRERDNVKDDEVDDLEKVDAAVMVGGFGGIKLGPWGVDLQVVQDVADGNEGVLATAAVSYTISVSKQMLVALAATTSYADGDYMSAYFGIDARNAARSGLKTYETDSGFKDVGAGVVVQYYPWDHVGFRALAKYTLLVGDAADSPVVDDEGDANQFFGGLMVTYRF